MMC